MNKGPIVVPVLTGPTASGKSAAGFALARRLGAEILSVDSMQVYRGMDIGTAKPSAADRAGVKHHGVDVADPAERFDVARFLATASAAIEGAAARGTPLLAVGGTPLYLRALREGIFEGPSADLALREALMERAKREGGAALHRELASLDPAAAARLHPNDLRRVTRALEVRLFAGRPISDLQTQWGREDPRRRLVIFALEWDRAALYRRIEARVDEMFRAGLVEEVRGLAARPGGLGPTASQGVGYRELLAHLRGELPLEAAALLVKRNTRRLAKRQLTWFRRFPGLERIPCGEPFDAEAAAEAIERKWRGG